MSDCTCGGDIPDVGLNAGNVDLYDPDCPWHGAGTVYAPEEPRDIAAIRDRWVEMRMRHDVASADIERLLTYCDQLRASDSFPRNTAAEAAEVDEVKP